MGINSLFTEQNSIDIFSESLSSLFDNKDQEDVINGILKDVLNLHHASRAYIFLYDFENGVQHYQYEVCAENVVPQIDIIGTIPLNDSLYFNKYIFEREPIVINNIEDIRFMAKSEYEILKQQDIKSLIVVPIIHRNKILGYIGVDIVDKIKIWTEQDITLLFLLSKIVGVSVAASVKLRESKQQKKALISNYNSILKVLGSLYYDIPIGIELYDSRGLLVDINNTDMKIFGIVDKEGILGLSIFENPLISDKEKQALRKGKSLELIIDYDFDKVHDYYKSTYSEDVKFITSYISPVKSDDGDIIYYLNFVNDITRIREMQQELIAAKEKAEESDRIKSAFLANMSHEIRTPLNAIVGFSNLLVVDHTESEKQDYIKLITSNSEILLNLINDILDLSKIEAGVINFYNTYFDLNDLFDELYSYFSMKVRKDVTLIAVKPKKSMKVLFDKKRLFQILSNFISNSVKFTMKGQIKFGYKIENNGLKVYVEDTGIGISDGQKDKIFKRFEKIESFSQGTGIGLSIVKALIDKANGVIEFSSEYGQGSTFWVWLPIEKIIDDDF